MSCPFLQLSETHTGTVECGAVIMPFEPTAVEHAVFCSTGRHRTCALYRHADRDLMRAVRREVSRAIG